MSQADLQKLSKNLEKAENAARIRLFGKASSQFDSLIKFAQSVEPSLIPGFIFLSHLYLVNQDVSNNKDPLTTGSLRRLVGLGPTTDDITLVMALPGGVYGEYPVQRVFAEARGILMMEQGLREKNPEVLEHAIKHFLDIDKNHLFFSRYVHVIGRRVTGRGAALDCEAQSNIIRASGIEDVNPSGAIPYYMLATRALRAARRKEEESKHRETLIGLKKVRRCWFCGRLVQGANHFKNFPSNVTPYFQNLLVENKEDLRVYEEETIVACQPCASAITKEANRIAQHYHEWTKHQIQGMKNEIAVLRQAISLQTKAIKSAGGRK